MQDLLLDEAIFRQKSKEEKIPFENLIAQVVLEEIIRKIYESEFADIFLIKNSVEILCGTLKGKINRRIYFCIKETNNFIYKKKEIGYIFAKLFRNIKKDSIHWNYSITESKIKDKPDNKIEICANMIGKIFSIQIPVEIKMEKCRQEKISSVQKEIILHVIAERKLKCNCYPGEEIVAEKFFNIIEKLELLSDLSDYLELYRIINSEMLSGRKVSEVLRKICKDYGIEMKQQRLDLLLSYQNNNYMMKKWKSYLRHEKIKEPKWEEVIETIEAFFRNIWDSLCQNMIYLGDWMPELGRFID